MKLYARVRRAVLVDGISRRAATREFGLHPTDEDLSAGTPFEAYFHAFEYFGGIPTRILYDNTKQTVARGLGDGQRQKTRTFSELQRHYLFAEKFGQPAKDNDKPGPYGQVFIRGVGATVYDPLHYLALLEHKSTGSGCAASSTDCRDWIWPTGRICRCLRCAPLTQPTT